MGPRLDGISSSQKLNWYGSVGASFTFKFP